MMNSEVNLQKQFQETITYLKEFLRQPIHRITRLPDWGLFHVLSLLLATSLISGALTGIVGHNIFLFLFGLFFVPIISLVSHFVLTSFFYYYFQVFEKRFVSFKKIWTLIVFANIPFFLFQTASSLIPPITIIGFLFTGMLLIVGLKENFQMEKRRAIRLVVSLFALVFLVWIWNKFSGMNLDRKL